MGFRQAALRLSRAEGGAQEDEEYECNREDLCGAAPEPERIEAPVALSGMALCKVDAGYGAIHPGDLLTTSPTEGHAMRSADPQPGPILAKALEPLDAGTGSIRVLVMLR